MCSQYMPHYINIDNVKFQHYSELCTYRDAYFFLLIFLLLMLKIFFFLLFFFFHIKIKIRFGEGYPF